MAVNVEQFALDFTLRDMADVKALEMIPKDREVQVGVIDVRTLYIESDDEIVERIRRVLEHASARGRDWAGDRPGLPQPERNVGNRRFQDGESSRCRAAGPIVG
jgi:Cobalamin-independent synthase, Catalytic domain